MKKNKTILTIEQKQELLELEFEEFCDIYSSLDWQLTTTDFLLYKILEKLEKLK